MKKKRPQQQVTPPTKGLNILAIKRSPEQVEPQKEQPAEVSMEKLEMKAASAPEPVTQTPVDNPTHADEAFDTSEPSEPVSDAIASSRESASEPVPDSNPSSPAEGAFFQAIGIIQADVTSDGDKTFVTIGDKSYGLYYASTHKKAYEALFKEISNTEITQQKLIVYPRITHYPGGKQPYRLAFQLVGFLKKEATVDGLASVLEENEFKISGLWQFIPVCRVPCISVFKNFNKERLEFIKSASVDKKVNYMKASHLPVVWRDAPVAPFRFNPKLDKEAQGKASFVQIQARFNSERDNFEFVSLLGVPSDSPPNYLKAGKKDKLSAAKTKLAAQKARKRSSSSVPDNNAVPQPKGATDKPKPKPKPKPKVVTPQSEEPTPSSSSQGERLT